MRAIGVIPARFGSTRFPGKPLHLIAGKPMIQWVVEGARKSHQLDEVLVATDHEDIYSLCKKLAVNVKMTDSSLPSGSDRVWNAVEKENYDIIINIQGDEPLVEALAIDSLVLELKKDLSIEMVTLARSLVPEDLSSLNSVKVLVDQLNDAIYFSRFPIPFSRGDAKMAMTDQSCVFKHLGMYGYRKDFLEKFCETQQTWIEQMESLEQLRALWLGAKIRVLVGNFEGLGVDTLEGVKKVEQWVLEKKSNLS